MNLSENDIEGIKKGVVRKREKERERDKSSTSLKINDSDRKLVVSTKTQERRK